MIEAVSDSLAGSALRLEEEGERASLGDGQMVSKVPTLVEGAVEGRQVHHGQTHCELLALPRMVRGHSSALLVVEELVLTARDHRNGTGRNLRLLQTGYVKAVQKLVEVEVLILKVLVVLAKVVEEVLLVLKALAVMGLGLEVEEVVVRMASMPGVGAVVQVERLLEQAELVKGWPAVQEQDLTAFERMAVAWVVSCRLVAEALASSRL